MAGTVTGDILIAVVKEITLYPDTVIYPKLSLFPGFIYETIDVPNITGDVYIEEIKVDGNIKCVQHTITGHIKIMREM